MYHGSACNDLKYSSYESSIDHINFICNGIYSCNNTNFMTNTTFSAFLAVDCVEKRSCRGSTSDIILDTQAGTDYNTSITCWMDDSCQHLSVISSKYTDIRLVIHKWSDNIMIAHEDIDKINITCGNDNDLGSYKY